MIKIFEMQQQTTNLQNHQSRIVEYKSFQNYLENVDENSLPPKEITEVYQKHVDLEKKTITFMFEHKIGEVWFEFIHFAQVIGEEDDYEEVNI